MSTKLLVFVVLYISVCQCWDLGIDYKYSELPRLKNKIPNGLEPRFPKRGLCSPSSGDLESDEGKRRDSGRVESIAISCSICMLGRDGGGVGEAPM